MLLFGFVCPFCNKATVCWQVCHCDKQNECCLKFHCERTGKDLLLITGLNLIKCNQIADQLQGMYNKQETKPWTHAALPFSLFPWNLIPSLVSVNHEEWAVLPKHTFHLSYHNSIQICRKSCHLISRPVHAWGTIDHPVNELTHGRFEKSKKKPTLFFRITL